MLLCHCSTFLALLVIVYHFSYYDNGRLAKLNDYLSPHVLDTLKLNVDAVRNIAREHGYTDTPLWLGETGPSYGGGAKGLSDRYVAGFRYVHFNPYGDDGA